MQIQDAQSAAKRKYEMDIAELQLTLQERTTQLAAVEHILDQRLAIARWQHAFYVLGTQSRSGHLQSGDLGTGPATLPAKVGLCCTSVLVRLTQKLILAFEQQKLHVLRTQTRSAMPQLA